MAFILRRQMKSETRNLYVIMRICYNGVGQNGNPLWGHVIMELVITEFVITRVYVEIEFVIIRVLL